MINFNLLFPSNMNLTFNKQGRKNKKLNNYQAGESLGVRRNHTFVRIYTTF